MPDLNPKHQDKKPDSTFSDPQHSPTNASANGASRLSQVNDHDRLGSILTSRSLRRRMLRSARSERNESW